MEPGDSINFYLHHYSLDNLEEKVKNKQYLLNKFGLKFNTTVPDYWNSITNGKPKGI